ncbi:MAG: NAD(P)-dependent oxidoreductase [Chloroflexota bacterium]|nr:NAD(P)-dependent oxidoreductase [Chloroflexota bacterium]
MEQAYPEMETIIVADSASNEEKVEACRNAEAIIMVAASISVDVLKGCPNVKLLQGIGAGFDKVDVKAINALGIPYANNGGSNAIPVAEFTLSLITGIARGVFRGAQNAKEGKWNSGLRETPSWEINGKCVGIIGMGAIGQRVAKMLISYDCDTVYYKRTRLSEELERELHARYLPLDELLQFSDVVTMHNSLNKSTIGIIGREQLAIMKPSSFLINTTRGACIDQLALYEALVNGRIAGAGLDVLALEPTPQDNPLWQLNNVVITPHQSGISQESVTRSAAFAFANVRRAVLGEPIQSLVIPE